MADTCIVCLGELAGAEQVPSTTSDERLARLASAEVEPASTTDLSTSKIAVQDDAETIAHLLPCGHDLHNECLKPWVERANSCPICRQSFNVVELKKDIYGPCIDSYVVQDKRQVAEIDPRMIVDDDIFEEPAVEPCIVCERLNDEEVLLLCDGCNASCHTYCADLDSVPAGSWFCHFCHEDGTVHNQRPTQARQGRTRGQRRRTATRRDHSPDAWARVWQSVWDNLNLDLEFPFDEEQEIQQQQQTRAHRRDFQEWSRRFRVAERQGGAARFRDTAATLLERRDPLRPSTPDPESQEELRAWNAFDKARELSTSSSSNNRRKRKSPTASPVEPAPPPERTLKRPRTRRSIANPERPAGASETADNTRVAEQAEPSTSGTRNAPNEVDGKSFFNSLLHEVETSPPAPTDINNNFSTSEAMPTSASSPVSPSLSAYSSPRSRSVSPPRFRLSRPQSPTPLSSRISPRQHPVQPVNGTPASMSTNSEHNPIQQPHGSPSIDTTRINDQYHSDEDNNVHEQSVRHDNQRRPGATGSGEHSNGTSASSPNHKEELDAKHEQIRSTKAEIQSMVSAALKPAYHQSQIDKDQYTDINRDVSRKLYDKVGADGGLSSDAAKKKWQYAAVQEVESAMKRLKNVVVPATPA